jgi:hypothetical protein
MRASENRKATALASRGWLPIPPEDAARVRALLETSNPR